MGCFSLLAQANGVNKPHGRTSLLVEAKDQNWIELIFLVRNGVFQVVSTHLVLPAPAVTQESCTHLEEGTKYSQRDKACSLENARHTVSADMTP